MLARIEGNRACALEGGKCLPGGRGGEGGGLSGESGLIAPRFFFFFS